MTGARLRSTRSAWPCAGQDLAHSPRNRAAVATMTGVDDRPLIPSRRSEHKRQTECGRQEGSLPGRAATLGAGSNATRARTAGVAINVTDSEALILQRLFQRHMIALNQSVTFWRKELAFGQKPAFELSYREKEAELMQRLYLALFDVNKQNPKLNKANAYKSAKNLE